ncbi:MAG: GLUG motif-containing protein [Promethearchaeati archaeon]
MKTIYSSKRSHYLTTVSVFLILAALIMGMVGCGGNDSDPYADYIKIYDWTDLDNIRNNLVAKYVLMNDLDSTTAGYGQVAGSTANGGKGWQPVGTAIVANVTEVQQLYIPLDPFDGAFDGQGYEIRHLFVDRPDDDFVGLFGYVGGTGVVRDVGAAEVVVTGHHYVGGLVGCNDGTVADSYSIGSVAGEKQVGGLVGYDSGSTVSNSYYNHDESLINGENMITTGALSDEDFEEWLTNSKFLDVSERLSEEDGYYLIQSVSDFKELLAFGQNASLRFRLVNDLDLSDDPNFYIPYMAAGFDGNGHIISNLRLNLNVGPLGLFGYLVLGGNITDIGVQNVNITGEGYGYVGGLVGINHGTISNSYATGNASGGYAVGGLVGRNFEAVRDSHATGSVTSDDDCVGGLVGDNTDGGTVNNCHSTSSVIGYGAVGGLLGQNYHGSVINSYSTGSVTGNQYAGGLMGTNIEGTVSNSFSNSNVTVNSGVVGNRAACGGLMGYNSGNVSDCFSIGSVTSDGDCVGGLVGDNTDGGTVNNCHSTSSVIGYGAVGGLLGQNYHGSVINSYSTGSVTGNQYVGGLVGSGVGGTVRYSFWDAETSGQATSDGGTGKTTTEMQDITTFSGATWDIVAVANPDSRNPSYIWNIVEDETYPFLSWEPVS